MPENGCERCKYYVKPEEPYHYEAHGYPEGVTVHGFCAKDARRSYQFYPVYIPEGCVCKEFSAKKGIKRRAEPQENQFAMEGMK